MISARSAEEKDKTPLGKQMESMSDAYKGFRKETDPVKGAALARDAQQGALKAAMEVPALIKDMPEGPEKIKAAVEYRKMMGKLFISLCEVEEAFNSGKLEDVAKLVTSLKEMKKDGHEKFVKEDE
ncbi:MAG: cytochrome b562 [Luteolibacter sp.]